MENINIVELLKDCPKGMELDCSICNGVKFIELDRSPNFPIVVRANNGYEFSLTKYGQVHNIADAKCVIFPKGKTTWEGFQRPFEDGDVVIYKYENGLVSMILNKFVNFVEVHYYCALYNNAKGFITNNYIVGEPKYTRFATEEEKQKLFQAIKDNGYKWNPKTKTLDKIKPKFKVNDQVKHIYDKDNRVITIIGMKEEYYDIIYFNNRKDDFQCEKVLFADQDKYELIPNKFDIASSKKATQHKFKVGDRIKHRWGEIVYHIIQITEDSYVLDNLYSIPISVEYMYNLIPNKFDITTLKPFNKVLIRDRDTDEWNCNLFSYYRKNSDRPYICIGYDGMNEYEQCIPYEGNEHLLGTSNDCVEYYKLW